MNHKTGVNRGPRRAGALAVVAAVAVAAAACGGGSAPSSASSTTFALGLAFARCMRSHGAASFPDPDASGGFHLNGPVDGQIVAAYAPCRHLLPGGGPSLAKVQQQLAQALPAQLKFAGCMHSHGVPDFPDPSANGQGTTLPKGAGINPDSPQFQAAVRTCESALPAGMHVSVGTSKSRGTQGS